MSKNVKLGTCQTPKMSLSNPRHQSFCNNCKKNGHLDKDCWSKGGGLEDKSPKQQRKWTQKARRSNLESHYGDEQSETNFTYLAESKQFMWILDGGSTIHICKSRSAFPTFTPVSDTIRGINKYAPSLPVHGQGNVNIIVTIGWKEQKITLENVSYCPDAWDNIISKSQMDQKGYAITKSHGQLKILKDNGGTIMEGQLHHRLYEINCQISPDSEPSEIAFNAQILNIDLWHHQFGCLNEKAVKKLSESKHKMVTRLDLKGLKGSRLSLCDGCAKGKHH
jgi:hypothetical protein